MDELHHERQPMHWLMYAISVTVAVLFIAKAAWMSTTHQAEAWWPFAVASGFFVLVVAVLASGMHVSVRQDGIKVTYGVLGWPRWMFKREDIEWYRPVTFSPLRDFGGWGIKMGRGNRMCINARGNKGVEIKLHGRKRTYVIGSDDPDVLVIAIKTATGIPPREG